MQSNLILTTAQAQAVYSAMCALNQVGGGQVEAYVDAAFALVREHHSGCVRVVSIRENDKREEYSDQAAFAAAYGLRDAPGVAALLAALQAEEEWRARDADGELDPEWDYDTMVAAKRRAAIAQATA